MTQSMNADLPPKEKMNDLVCPEIGALLGGPENSLNIDPRENLEDEIIKVAVDTLVKYGKDRGQIIKISRISVLLCQAIGLGGKYCEVLSKASLIYDIGNLGIDAEIYKKDNRLSFEEFEIIKHHTTLGRDALFAQNNPTLDMAALISAQHHEWYDGGGYPYGLKGLDISASARIVALADAVVALYTPRHGRQAMSFDNIRAHIRKRSGLHFDSEIVDKFFENIAKVEDILNSDFSKEEL